MPKNTRSSSLMSSNTFKPENARILYIGDHLNSSCFYILNVSYKDKIEKKYVDLGEPHSLDIDFYNCKTQEKLPIYSVKYRKGSNGKPILVATPAIMKFDTSPYSSETEYFVFNDGRIIDNPEAYHSNFNEQEKLYYFNKFIESQAMREIKSYRNALTQKQSQGNQCIILAQKIKALNYFIKAAENLEGEALMQILADPHHEIYKTLIKPRPTCINFFNFFSINTSARSAKETNTYKLLENLKKHPCYSYLSEGYVDTQNCNSQLEL
ncbi:hypothetical protein [Legionella jamestowniensis]|uniref:Uncharacterized protein n=1 Tax=Legionella jamestowniensis TaxID=455 RepID=A0A0W0UPQ2_9GAMM|nr:hypothetical protein [Legionella jamestowniensis]KTD09449.1 hypothetical protein Ljam_0799 [Legionella jamestowniensis]SFL89522.1 hypothetical protein SAMN02746073_2470 [Legionella jamestowniensis DSM 19215]